MLSVDAKPFIPSYIHIQRVFRGHLARRKTFCLLNIRRLLIDPHHYRDMYGVAKKICTLLETKKLWGETFCDSDNEFVSSLSEDGKFLSLQFRVLSSAWWDKGAFRIVYLSPSLQGLSCEFELGAIHNEEKQVLEAMKNLLLCKRLSGRSEK